NEFRSEVGGWQTNREPCSGDEESFLQHHPDHRTAASAEGDADTDLAGAARNRVRHRTVETDARNHERQDGERGAEAGEDDLLADGAVDEVGLRANVGDRDVRVALTYDFANFGDMRQRIAGHAQFVVHGVYRPEKVGGERQVDRRVGRLFE